MTQTFTPEDLVRHLYHEDAPSERRAMREALEEDYLLREEYNDLREATRALPKVSFKPSKKTLASILDYSRQEACQEQC